MTILVVGASGATGRRLVEQLPKSNNAVSVNGRRSGEGYKGFPKFENRS
jgi:uncharacterized protein YbjT (DUF2867 family)